MAKTMLADIIVPEVFERYAIERTAELSAFGQSGIIEHSPEFDALAAGGGITVEMPFWKDLSAERQVLSDSASLAINKITSDKDIARIQNDGQTWGVNHLAKVTSGDDPMGRIVELVAGYWARVDQGMVIACLKGIFASATMAANKLAIASESIAGQSSSTRLNGSTFVDATLKLGDRGDRLTAIQIDQGVTTVATKRGLRPTAIPDITARARTVFKLVNGVPRAFEADGQTVRYGRDGVSPMTLEEWVDTQVADAPQWKHLRGCDREARGSRRPFERGGDALSHGSRAAEAGPD